MPPLNDPEASIDKGGYIPPLHKIGFGNRRRSLRVSMMEDALMQSHDVEALMATEAQVNALDRDGL
jgi:hypothetical protein